MPQSDLIIEPTVATLTAKLKQVVAPTATATTTEPIKKPTAATLIRQATPLRTTTLEPKAKFDPTQFFHPDGEVITTNQRLRIAIIGGPGSGKTTSCLTFPNRKWFNFDNKLPAGESSIPFHDSAFCGKIAARTQGNIVNRRDAFKFWLRDNHHKFHEDQTAITDSWTFLMNAFEVQTNAEDAVLDANNSSNKYYVHAQRLKYCREIFDYFKAMRCTVIVTFHESADRDKDGELNGKICPLMDGKFKDQIFGHFTDVWRQRANIFDVNPKTGIRILDKERGNKPMIKRAHHNGNPDWVWFWQLLGDSEFDTNCNPDLGAKVRKHNQYLVPADYSEIKRIMSLP